MTALAEKATAELIDLLFREEDRVTWEHIQELAARPDAVEPLREILRNEHYWFAGEYGEFWIELHAIAILSQMRAAAALPEMMQALRLCYESDFEWIQERIGAALARFGEIAIAPLMEFVLRFQHSDTLGSNTSFARSAAVDALTRIALEHPVVREQVLEFLCARLTDPLEDDPLFLGLIADRPAVLDRERGLAAARNAFARGAVDETIQGGFRDMVSFLTERNFAPDDELTDDRMIKFYEPTEIAARQRRWAKETHDEAARLMAGAAPAELKRQQTLAQLREKIPGVPNLFPVPAPEADDEEWDDDEEEITAPAGYVPGESGGFTRADKIGRNDPCLCGSGKKYKKCCGR